MLITKTNWCARTLLALLSLGCAASVQAATITTFSTRTDFNAAVGASTYETFDSVGTDTPFHSTPFDAGAFTLSMTGNANHLNMIDVPPAASLATSTMAKETGARRGFVGTFSASTGESMG